MASLPWYRSDKAKRRMSSIFTPSGIYLLLAPILASLFYLTLDTWLLLGAALVGRFRLVHHRQIDKRQLLLKNPRFYPKTILITGINTARGLKLARQFYYGGHRVIGADVGSSFIRSGGSMSNTIFAYYSLSKSKSQYVSGLIDIIHREKVDLWIPYASNVNHMDDAIAKSTIESRTSCRCFHLNVDYATLLGRDDSFLQHLRERGLPVIEKHHVQSRDSVHRILNRSPDKFFLLHHKRLSNITRQDVVSLPKRTPSQTYAEVSLIHISKDEPWVLHQFARLGSYWADLVLVRGRVEAMKIRPLRPGLSFEDDSRMSAGLRRTTRELMDEFAGKAGPHLSGHVSIMIMVDEAITSRSISYPVYIGGCAQGSIAVAGLLDDEPPSDLYSSYLELLSPETNGHTNPKIKSSTRIRPGSSRKWSDYTNALNQMQIPSPWMVDSAEELWKKLWKRTRRFRDLVMPFVPFVDRLEGFSVLDPLPWWWHYHISQPVNGIVSIFDDRFET